MSDSERWFVVLHGYNWVVETEGKEEDENFIADCGADDEAEGLARGIASDHNACLGIKDPATTVPELVAVCRRLMEEFSDASQYKGKYLREKHGDDKLLIEAEAVLAKTGKT